MYTYLFGPVPSRRLGMSLGVDLVPKKVCSLNCVYCEVGKTTKLSRKREEFIPVDKIKAELEDYFSQNPDPDYITFSGYGEPTLNIKIGEILQFIKQLKPSIPLALLTNGTLLNNPKVREELMKLDLILPSLDAASQDVFEQINCPASGLTIDEYIQGLVDFSYSFKGKIWLEIFILPGYNDTKTELAALKEAIVKINPTSVQVNTLDRPGTIGGLRAASLEELEEVLSFWNLDTVEIIAKAPQRKKIQAYRKDAESAILETISRRPCTLDDLIDILGMHANEINKYLDVLDADAKIESVNQDRGVFYQLKGRN